MNKVLIEKLFKRLLIHPLFKGFKYRSKDCSIIKKEQYGWEKIEFQNWISYDQKTAKKVLMIKPVYSKRFNILHEWFEKFSFKRLSDQRDNYSVGFEGVQFGRRNEFSFYLNDIDNSEVISSFENEVIENTQLIFNKFSSISDLYEFLIKPVLEGEKELPNLGADWIFEYLTITKIKNKESFEPLRMLIYSKMNEMYEKGEPNTAEYYQKFDEIIDYLNELEFKTT